MAMQLFSLFFSDRLRAFGTIALMVLILILIVVTWAYPRTSDVDRHTTQTLENVSTQIQRAADTLEKQSANTAKLNETLSKNIDAMENSRNEGYNLLLNRYGLDINQAAHPALPGANPALAAPQPGLQPPPSLVYEDPTPFAPDSTTGLRFPQTKQ